MINYLNELRMNYKKIYLALLVLLAMATQSCSKMNDLTDMYLNEGEIVYAAQVDSVEILAGENRIQLNLIVKAQRIEKIRVYWNNYTDSVDVNIGGTTGVFPATLSNMPEGGYLFQLVSFDKFGNRSLQSEATGSSYGESYKQTLSNRTYITEFTRYDMAGDSMVIYWGGSVRGAIGMTLQYTDKSDKVVKMDIPVDAATSTLHNLKGSVSYNSSFLPTENAIDTFATAPSTIPVYYERPIDKKEWKITAFSSASASPAWPATSAIDGDINTPWHTEHNPTAPFPHYFIVDMGEVADISSFDVYRRMDDSAGAQPTHQIFYAETLVDPTDSKDAGWKEYGTFPFDNVVSIPQFSRTNGVVKARYFMYYVASNSRSSHAYMGEIGANAPVNATFVY